MSLVQYGYQDIETERVYYKDTAALREGQVICYEPLDDAAVNAPGTASTAKETWLGVRTAIIDAANATYFAGIVSPGDVGKTGPCYIDVLKPKAGDVLQVELDGTTDVAVDDSLELDATLAGFIKDATVAAGVYPRARAQEAYTTDATLAAKWVVFY